MAPMASKICPDASISAGLLPTGMPVTDHVPGSGVTIKVFKSRVPFWLHKVPANGVMFRSGQPQATTFTVVCRV